MQSRRLIKIHSVDVLERDKERFLKKTIIIIYHIGIREKKKASYINKVKLNPMAIYFFIPLFLCVCVCVLALESVRACMCLNVCVHACARIYVCVFVHARECVYGWICASMCACLRPYLRNNI